MSSTSSSDPFDPVALLETSRIQNSLAVEPQSHLPSPIPEIQLPTFPGIRIEHQDPQWISTLVPELQNRSPVTLFDDLEKFTDALVSDQLQKPDEMLKLNRTRRESLGRFLAELSRQPEPENPELTLRSFVRLDRTKNEDEALKQLFKQIAFVQLGKALLLKSWSAQQNIPLLQNDLKDLTSAVERGLRAYIHLQTTTCQLITGNFYSWYKLDPARQQQLWNLLGRCTDLAAIREWLLDRAIRLSAETLGERDRYSRGFYHHLWQAIKSHRLFSPLGTAAFAFSPTLRDGSLLDEAPNSLEWIGFESLTFELLFCEIRYFWVSPKAPPLWMKGNGLEMSMEHQSTLLVTHSGKQNSLQQLDSITSCELALIAEESIIRTQSRSLAAQALRKQVDQHSILKKIKQPTTTRGMYQACQALEKLRQGGVLIWAREELLTEASGKPALQFILNQAKIALIADFSALQCECGHTQKNLPKALYLLKKETQLEPRKNHRPLMVKAYGTLRGESEVALLMDRVISLVQNPEQSFPLEPFQLHARVSPMDQREWEQHWFNPTDDHLVDRIEDMKRNSAPLGQFAQVRSYYGATTIDFNHEPTLFPTEHHADTGFYVWIENSKNGNEVHTALPSKLPKYLEKSSSLYFVTPIQSQMSVPLQILIKSQLTRDWLNYSVERKKGHWILKEQDLKSIPIPTHIAQHLSQPLGHEHLPSNIQSILAQVPTEPGLAVRQLEILADHLTDELLLSVKDHRPIPLDAVRAEAFVVASQVLFHVEAQQATLFSLITPDEQIDYPKLFKTVLTSSDVARLDQHPWIRYSMTILPHQPIVHVQAVKHPTPGILLSTRQGLSQQLYVQDPWLRDRCLEAIETVRLQIAEPTWNELCNQVFLPKNPNQALTMSAQILKAFSDEKLKRKELTHLIGACLSSGRNQKNKVGMLQ